VRERIRQFLVENFLYGTAPAGFNDSASLLDSGVMDSTGVMELVLFLEEEFGVKVADDEVVPENLDSIERICTFVRRKLAAVEP